MKTVIIMDTETTGRLESDPHIVQIALQTIAYSKTDSPVLIQERMAILRCPIPIPSGAMRVHGISDVAASRGFPAAAVLKWVAGQAQHADLLVCHNLRYDQPVVDANLKRLDNHGPCEWKSTYCTMLGSKDLCKLPGKYDDYKWPGLAEALKILCGHDLQGAHDALADVRGTRVLLDYLVDAGAVPELKGYIGSTPSVKPLEGEDYAPPLVP